MKVKVFDSGDEPYKKWLQNHPEGYVLNTRRSPDTTYVIFHRSGCSEITKIKTGEAGGFTERKYIKVCAEETEPLAQWMVKNRSKAVAEWMRETPPDEKNDARPCGKCEPDVEVEEFGFYEHPEEETEPETHEEGSTATVEVNRYERSEAARQKCLEHYGAQCQVCGLRFEERYGEVGEGFIEVHHEVPLSKTDGDVEVDPIEDLKPVCPNCHAMLHQESPPLSIDELRERLRMES
jgi:5-methylcytosine-specific restriction endonuclease McrA